MVLAKFQGIKSHLGILVGTLEFGERLGNWRQPDSKAPAWIRSRPPDPKTPEGIAFLREIKVFLTLWILLICGVAEMYGILGEIKVFRDE